MTDTARLHAQEAVRQLRQRIRQLDDAGLDLLFREAHTHNKWLDIPVPDATLAAIFDLMKMAPTSANCAPARIVFVRSQEAKQRLAPAMSAGNLAKTMAAPVTAIFGYDTRFYERMDFLFPHEKDAKSWFTGSPAKIQENAFRNGTLQAAYFLIAARAAGLDAGPMSGFDNDKVDAEFFAGTAVKSNFLCNLGHGDPAGVHARAPRFAFADACRIV